MPSKTAAGAVTAFVLGLAVSLAGCGDKPTQPLRDEALGAKAAKEGETMATTLLICSHGQTLGGLDGQKIRLVGLYRKSLTATKMRGPREFRGKIHIELVGTAADAVPKGSSSLPSIVEIGLRPPEEVARLVDQRVRVDGVLILDPYQKVRESKPLYATVIHGPPQLREVETVERVDAD